MIKIEPLKGLIITAYIMVIIFMLMVAGLLIITFYPYMPLRIDSFPVNKTQVQRGCELCFTMNGEKYHNVSASVTVELVNGESFNIMSYQGTNPKGEIHRIRCFIVPYNIKPNKYRIRWTAVYPMNAFNYVRTIVHSDWVDVK